MNTLLAPERVEELKSLANQVNANALKEEDPLKRLLGIAEQNGIKVMQSDLYEISGALRKEGNHWVIYVNAFDSPKRQLFTIAHELGHFFAHKEKCDEFIDGQFISRAKQEEFAREKTELEANEFAGNLIMPEDKVRALAVGVINADTIRSLAKSFGVSTIAMQTRLHNLGYDTSATRQAA